MKRMLVLSACAPLLLARVAMGAESTTATSTATAVAEPATATATLPDARQILRDFLAASGGAKALDALRNLVIDGTQSVPSQNISGTITMHMARPGLLLVRGEMQGIGKIEQGYDGTIGWEMNPITGNRIIEGAELAQLKRAFDETLGLSDLDKLYPTATTLGRETFEGKEAWKVMLGTPTGRTMTAYFDPTTKMQVGLEMKVPSPIGDIPATVTFEDYGEFGGVKFPRKSRQAVMGIAMVTTFDSVKTNVADFPKIAPPPEILALMAAPAAAATPGQ